MKTISPSEVADLMKTRGPIDLIDVRTPIEFAVVHARGARLAPLDELDPQQIVTARTAPTDQPIYVICKSGGRAAKACERFEQAGISNVVSVEGGTAAWEATGLPVVRTKKMSLERQVRLVAGLLILIGAALGFLVHPAFYILSAFVGAGLTFSGITDFCGMALLLAKMPWNNVSCNGDQPCH